MDKHETYSIFGLLVIIVIILLMLLFGKCKNKEKYTSSSVSLTSSTSDAQDIQACNNYLSQNGCDPSDPSSCDGPVYYCKGIGAIDMRDADPDTEITACSSGKIAFTASQCGNWVNFPYTSGFMIDNTGNVNCTQNSCIFPNNQNSPFVAICTDEGCSST